MNVAAADLDTFLTGTLRFPPAAATAIAARARRRRYSARQVIIRQEETCNDVHLLVSGRASVRHLALDGRVLPLHDLGPGDLFGRIDSNRPRQAAEVAAIEAVLSAIFDGGDFVALVENHACLGAVLAQSLLRRLAALADQLIARTTLSAGGRIHAELLRRAGPDRRISPPPVLSELATAVDTRRETVSRTIGALERRGIITRDAEALTIVAPQRLAEMVI
jgi:CRP/FNR family transcriptional regulator, cyclic AMP receptor protein